MSLCVAYNLSKLILIIIIIITTLLCLVDWEGQGEQRIW